MSFTANTFNTLIKKGLKTKSGDYIQGNRYYRMSYPPSQIKDFSITFTPIIFLGSRSAAYTQAFNEVIYEPPTIVTTDPDPNFVPNVAAVKYVKSANTTIGGFDMVDSNGNSLSSEITDFPNGRPVQIIDENTGDWVDDPNQDMFICLACLQDAVGNIINAGFAVAQTITADSKSYGAGAGNPGVDVIKNWDYVASISSDANFMANFDAWCYGEYWDPSGNAGHPDGNPDGSDGGGGDGQWPNHSMQIPGLPTKSAASAGFMRIYNITESKLNDLASELWNPSFWNTIVKNFQSPFENIISLGLVPFNGFIGNTEPIQIGNYESSVQADALSNVYYEIDCGNITFHQNWGLGDFLDFEPHLKLQVFCPYCGFVDVSPSEFMYKTMNLKYHFDIFSGACVAYISAIEDGVQRILYQKEGNIKTEIPINAQNYTNVYNNAIGSVFSTAGAFLAGGAMGGIAGALAGGAIGATRAMASMASVKPDYQRSGNIGGMHGIMGMQLPYVVCTLPKSVEAPTYKQIHGYPSGKRIRIGDASGFLQSLSSYNDIESIPCTSEERDMILKGLADGIQI